MRITVVGEGMLELSQAGGAWRLGYGGDTLNTAIHLARAGHGVRYLTALGAYEAQINGRSCGGYLDFGAGTHVCFPRQSERLAIATENNRRLRWPARTPRPAKERAWPTWTGSSGKAGTGGRGSCRTRAGRGARDRGIAATAGAANS